MGEGRFRRDGKNTTVNEKRWLVGSCVHLSLKEAASYSGQTAKVQTTNVVKFKIQTRVGVKTGKLCKICKSVRQNNSFLK